MMMEDDRIILDLVESVIDQSDPKRPLASAYEGYAILQEIVEDLNGQIGIIKTQMSSMWTNNVRNGEKDNFYIESITKHVKILLLDAIDMYAMGVRYRDEVLDNG